MLFELEDLYRSVNVVLIFQVDSDDAVSCQQSCGYLLSAFIQSSEIQITKGMTAMLVYVTGEDDQNSFVNEHQHGGYDVRSMRCIVIIDSR